MLSAQDLILFEYIITKLYKYYYIYILLNWERRQGVSEPEEKCVFQLRQIFLYNDKSSLSDYFFKIEVRMKFKF